MTADDEVDHFAVLGIQSTASEAEIKKAYRQRALQLHPDKNRDMDASVVADRFNALALSYEILSDPLARAALVKRSQEESARKERRGAFDGKRKAMAEELERREADERKRRKTEASQQKNREQMLHKLKEEGRKLMEAKAAEAELSRVASLQSQDSIPAAKEDHTHEAEPELGPLDLTIRLRFPSLQLSELTAPRAATSSLDSIDPCSALSDALTMRFGPLDALIFPPLKDKDIAKQTAGLEVEATALATFRSLDAAYAAVMAGRQMRMGSGVLADVWASWASAPKKVKSRSNVSGPQTSPDPRIMPGEPARVTWWRERGLLQQRPEEKEYTMKRAPSIHSSRHTSPAATASVQASGPRPTFSFAPRATHPQSGQAANHYESVTLMRLREAERQRIEEAIRSRDLADE